METFSNKELQQLRVKSLLSNFKVVKSKGFQWAEHKISRDHWKYQEDAMIALKYALRNRLCYVYWNEMAQDRVQWRAMGFGMLNQPILLPDVQPLCLTALAASLPHSDLPNEQQRS
jgi:hypothetical protein